MAVTWWLGRAIAGPVAGAVAGLLMAVSASAVDESTFIWNPNLIALSSSVALAAAWRAWTGGRAGWWVVAALGVIVTMHCHVLGSVLLPPVVGLWIADVRRFPRAACGQPAFGPGSCRRSLLVVSYVPLAIHELTQDFSEVRAAADFIAGGGEASATALPLRLVIVGLRVLAWPLTGLVTEAPIAAVLAAGLVIGLLAWRVVAGHRRRAGGGPLVRGDAGLDHCGTDRSREWARDGDPRPAERPLPCVRRPDRVRRVGMGAAALARGRPARARRSRA